MEEYVGQLWDKFITGAAEGRSVAAAVALEEVAPSLAIYFRALGGDPGLTITAAQATRHGGRLGPLFEQRGIEVNLHIKLVGC